VLKVLRGEIDLEKYDSCWLLTELAKPTYDIRRRRLVVGGMLHSGESTQPSTCQKCLSKTDLGSGGTMALGRCDPSTVEENR
jgi:hypothetical protein